MAYGDFVITEGIDEIQRNEAGEILIPKIMEETFRMWWSMKMRAAIANSCSLVEEWKREDA